jgi:hypothetical protein
MLYALCLEPGAALVVELFFTLRGKKSSHKGKYFLFLAGHKRKIGI